MNLSLTWQTSTVMTSTSTSYISPYNGVVEYSLIPVFMPWDKSDL